MKSLHAVAFILLIIGGLNWLLIGVFNWGVGDVLPAIVSKIVYILVGLSAIYLVATHKKDCKCCTTSSPSSMGGGAM